MRLELKLKRVWQKGAMCLVFLGLSLGVCRAQLGLPPIILTPPSAKTVQNGDSVQFTVGLSISLSPLSYQWRFNNTNISGATSSTLTVTNATSASAGNYCVAVKNASGTTVSSDALLSILGGILNPVVSVLSSTLTTAGFSLHLSVPAGSNYVISACSGGVSGWTPIYTNNSATGTVTFTDSDATNYSSRFYRVQLK